MELDAAKWGGGDLPRSVGGGGRVPQPFCLYMYVYGESTL